MIVKIPYHENYLITKDVKVYRDIDNKINRIIYLILLTFIRNRIKESTTTIES